MIIGPKPIEEITDDECDEIEAASAEGVAHIVVAGDIIAAIVPGKTYSSGPWTHIMLPDPED